MLVVVWSLGPFNSKGGFVVLNKTLVLSLLALSFSAWGAPKYDESKFYEIASIEVKEVSHDVILDQEVQRTVSEKYLQGSRLETAGKVIGVAKDLVALGESLYTLISKGKPNVSTNTAPISVLPKVGGNAVDILDTESWTVPVKKTFSVNIKNLYNVNVVSFRYSVIYSYRGSYNGKGAYITAAQIQPDYVNVLFGFDFTATMKLTGIVNQGTRENPVAGATMALTYTTSNILNSRTQIDTFFVNGRGGFKKL